MITKRTLLVGAGGAVLAIAGLRYLDAAPSTAGRSFEITKTDAEWRAVLSKAQFDILRKHGTERAGTSPLNAEQRDGVYACAGCDLDLFSSKTKYESGTGWPSFYDPLPNAIGTAEDRSLLSVRTEVHCRRCGGHLGHVFDDGPKPTGLRYCLNGLALKFKPGANAAS